MNNKEFEDLFTRVNDKLLRDKIISEGFYHEIEIAIKLNPNDIGFIFNGILRRNNLLCWCGYVEVPKWHEINGKGYDDFYIDAHGGITFSGLINKKWYIGFDCAHAGDLTPLWDHSGIYKDKDFATKEIEKIAKQLFENSDILELDNKIKRIIE